MAQVLRGCGWPTAGRPPHVGVNFQVGAGLGAVWSWACTSSSHQSSPNSREASIIPEDSQVPGAAPTHRSRERFTLASLLVVRVPPALALLGRVRSHDLAIIISSSEVSGPQKQ